MSSSADIKWIKEEKIILSILMTIIPKENFELEKGNHLNNEPDGVITINQKRIGLEVTQIHNYDKSFQKESELNKVKTFIQSKLDEKLNNYPVQLSISFDGNSIPVKRKARKDFMSKAVDDLVGFLNFKLEEIKSSRQAVTIIEGVEFKICTPNAQTIKLAVTYGQLIDLNQVLPYDSSVLKTIEKKNSNNYSTYPTWLFLKESTSQCIVTDCDPVALHNKIKSIPNLKFQSIYLKIGYIIAGIYPHPRIYRLFPDLAIYY